MPTKNICILFFCNFLLLLFLRFKLYTRWFHVFIYWVFVSFRLNLVDYIHLLSRKYNYFSFCICLTFFTHKYNHPAHAHVQRPLTPPCTSPNTHTPSACLTQINNPSMKKLKKLLLQQQLDSLKPRWNDTTLTWINQLSNHIKNSGYFFIYFFISCYLDSVTLSY